MQFKLLSYVTYLTFIFCTEFTGHPNNESLPISFSDQPLQKK